MWGVDVLATSGHSEVTGRQFQNLDNETPEEPW